MKSILLSLAFALIGLAGAHAQVPMTGRFVAEARCPALQSIAKKSNPGNVSTEPGKAYRLLGRNASDASYYYIEFENADPARRWVAVGCGRIEPDASFAAGNGADRAPAGRDDHSHAPVRLSADRSGSAARSNGSASLVLAISWHPAFCETRPKAADCRTGNSPARLVLHGLWPQPFGRDYCGVDPATKALDRGGRWHSLPALALSAGTREALERIMPGTASDLQRHEWTRHGTCYGSDAETYFSQAIALAGQVKNSAVDRLLTASIGKTLQAAEIRAAFDEAFGPGAGERVEVVCRNEGSRRLVYELQIALSRPASKEADLRSLIAEAPRARLGCKAGEVDPAGNRT